MNLLNRLQEIDGNLPKEVGGLRCVTVLTDQQELAISKSDCRAFWTILRTPREFRQCQPMD
jgi:hypothetical protein